MNSTLQNIFFLFLGVVVALIITYVIDRLKEGRMRRKVAEVIRNEISNCSESANIDLNNLENIINTPVGVRNDRTTLTQFLLLREVFATTFFDIYKNSIHLFREETQKAISKFYTLMGFRKHIAM